MIDFIYPLIGYLLGSVPFGLVLTLIFGYGDIRRIGSGNIGATNVLRTGNKLLAALTLLLDAAKGAFAVWLSFASGDAAIILCTGLLAVLGHMFPVWLKFKGGKGVATALGVILMLMLPLGLTLCLIWLVMALVVRISSAAALTAFALAPLLALMDMYKWAGSFGWASDPKLSLLCLVLAVLIFWKHKDNIRRLKSGDEPKIGRKKNATDPAAP